MFPSHFILWKKKANLKSKDILIWDGDGNAFAQWDGFDNGVIINCRPLMEGSQTIGLNYTISPNQYHRERDERRDSMLCFAMVINDNSEKYGICIEFDQTPEGIYELKFLKKQLLMILTNSVVVSKCNSHLYKNLNN